MSVETKRPSTAGLGTRRWIPAQHRRHNLLIRHPCQYQTQRSAETPYLIPTCQQVPESLRVNGYIRSSSPTPTVQEGYWDAASGECN